MARTVRTANNVSEKPAALWVGYLSGGLGAAFFATKGIVIKLAIIEQVDVVTTLTWRMIIAVPFFIIIGTMGYRDRRANNPEFSVSSGTIVRAALIGMIGYYVASYLDFAGLVYISAQFDRLILLTYPFFVVLFSMLAFGRRVSIPMIAALLISYAGLALIFARDLALEGSNVTLGALLVLGAAISFALYQLLAKPVIDQIGARLFTSIAMTGAGVAVIIHFALTHQVSDLVVSPKAMWLMLAIGTVSTVLPAYLISAAIGRIGPVPTSVMGNVSPLVTIVLAVTILGEAFSVWHALGAALVLLGIFTFTGADRRMAKVNRN